MHDVHPAQLLPCRQGFDAGLDARKAGQVVHPQADIPAAALRQPARQPPADADVAVVVDDPAKDVCLHGGFSGTWRARLRRLRAVRRAQVRPAGSGSRARRSLRSIPPAARRGCVALQSRRIP
ncbi:hypothetical protein G6F22_020307 [Rhizopus arrhizus]|nr:hypothetical protein G6F22_020307 [Rhizopus arrhizus]